MKMKLISTTFVLLFMVQRISFTESCLSHDPIADISKGIGRAIIYNDGAHIDDLFKWIHGTTDKIISSVSVSLNGFGKIIPDILDVIKNTNSDKAVLAKKIEKIVHDFYTIYLADDLLPKLKVPQDVIDELDKILTDLENIINKLVAGEIDENNNLPAIVNNVLDVMPDVTKLLYDFEQVTLDRFYDVHLLSGLSEKSEEMFDSIKSILNTIYSMDTENLETEEILNIVVAIAPDVAVLLEDMRISFLDPVRDNFPVAVEFLEVLYAIEGSLEALIKVIPAMIPLGQTIYQEINELESDGYTFVHALMKSMFDKKEEISAAIFTFESEFLQGLIETLPEALRKPSEFLQALLHAIVKSVKFPTQIIKELRKEYTLKNYTSIEQLFTIDTAIDFSQKIILFLISFQHRAFEKCYEVGLFDKTDATEKVQDFVNLLIITIKEDFIIYKKVKLSLTEDENIGLIPILVDTKQEWEIILQTFGKNANKFASIIDPVSFAAFVQVSDDIVYMLEDVFETGFERLLVHAEKYMDTIFRELNDETVQHIFGISAEMEQTLRESLTTAANSFVEIGNKIEEKNQRIPVYYNYIDMIFLISPDVAHIMENINYVMKKEQASDEGPKRMFLEFAKNYTPNSPERIVYEHIVDNRPVRSRRSVIDEDSIYYDNKNEQDFFHFNLTQMQGDSQENIICKCSPNIN